MAPKKQKPKRRLTPAQQKQKSNRMTWIAIAAIVAVVVIFGALAASGILGNRSDTVDLGPTPDPIEPTKVVLETTAGNITIDLRVDKPITSTNFIDLVNAGEYDNTSFYRTVAGFVIQGGKGIMGGDLPEIRDEIGTNNRNTKYTIAMANHGVNSASSEFFINLVDNGQRTSGFDSKYTVFGTVIDGQDVVDMIANAPVTSDPSIMSGEESIPIDPVVILRATVLP